MWLDLRKKIPHAICYTCSGKSKNGTPLIRYFPTLQEMLEHCRTHSSTVSAHSYFNLEINPNEWVLILATAKPKAYVLIRKETITNRFLLSEETWVLNPQSLIEKEEVKMVYGVTSTLPLHQK